MSRSLYVMFRCSSYLLIFIQYAKVVIYFETTYYIKVFFVF